MARRRFGFKPTLREQQKSHLAAMRFMAMAAPEEKRVAAEAYIDTMEAQIKPKRERAAPRALEAPVVSAIADLLAVHPRVLWAARFNSGQASYEAKSGKYAPVAFHRIVRQPYKTRMPDFFGLIVDTSGRMEWAMPFAVEAKAPGWSKPRDDREREQAAFLRMVTNCGGIGIFATSAEEVAEALK